MNLYFIKRGSRPEYHRAPYHQHLICTRKGVAKWGAGWTGDGAWVWEHLDATQHGGWLLVKWHGLDIDYGHLVRTCTLPDGTPAAFYHEYRDLGFDKPGGPAAGAKHLGYSAELQEPWSLLPQAVWWSTQPIPEWLRDRGVRLPVDGFSLRKILEQTDGANRSQMSREKQWDTPPIAWPAWWPDPETVVDFPEEALI